MVFSSVPVYLDPPNWQQQPTNQQGLSITENLQLPPPPAPPHVGGSVGPIRPGSMADRARLAKLPQPEAGLKCPRCESTNTKFCYFNNYSLSQPRHFCKTCRRYWTRGGALRNVPVGGGCRRNKKNKRSSSKSPVAAEQQTGSNSASAVPSEISGHLPQQSSQLPFMASLHNLAQYGVGNIGLNIGGIQPQTAAAAGVAGETSIDNFQMGGTSGGSNAILSAGGGDQWRLQQLQQFPLLAGFEQSLYPFHGEGIEPPVPSVVGDGQLRSKMLDSGVTQLAPVKMEANQLRQNLTRQILGVSENNQYWGGNTWTDLSGLSSSSTTHLL